MIRTYIMVAARNIAKRSLYSCINIFGLSIATAFCILIYLYIDDEKSFDQFHKNKDDIFLLTQMHLDAEGFQRDEADPYRYTASLPAMFAEVMQEEAPQVKHITRFSNDTGIMRFEKNIFKQKTSFADSGFFDMFSFKVLHGSLEKIFENQNEAVLTKKVAKKYFGDEDPVGRMFTLELRESRTFIVAAVIQNPPSNSSLDFEMILPVQNRPFFAEHRQHWGYSSYPTFVQLHPGAAMTSFAGLLDTIAHKYTGVEISKWRERENISDSVIVSDFGFTSLNDLHTDTRIKWNRSSDPSYTFILACIGVLILVIAAINYISLALTSSASRRTEVGIRKVVGAQKIQLIYQFGFESVLLAFASMIVGVALTGVLLSSFNQFTGKNIEFSSVSVPELAAFCVCLSLFIGLIAGMYPAFFLSRFLPVVVLKGIGTSKLQTGFGKPLVILQFALSAFLAISTVIMYRQMKFVTTKDLGYDQDQILIIPTLSPGAPSDRIVTQFRNKTKDQPSVIGITGTSITLGNQGSYYGYKINGQNKTACVYSVDAQYIPLLNLQLITGRNFDERIASDSNAVIVNEALVNDMGWNDPLSEYLNWYEDQEGPGAKVIGVVKDYHFHSLENEIGPMFLSLDKERIGHLNNILVKISPDNIPGTLERLQVMWKELNLDRPFEYSFLDENVAKQYEQYERWLKIAGLSTSFAILIASLGLFGLAGVNAVNKTREIGIRKVMGADLLNIIILLNKQYLWMSLVAFVLATPVSWYVMHQWITSFEYKIGIGWEVFAVCMASSMVLVFMTVSYHTIRTALINPAETLKYE